MTATQQPEVATEPAIAFTDVQAAAERLQGVAHRTPVLTSRTLNDLTGAEVFLKAEPFQRMGAFKFRGAYNAISALPEDVRARGIVTNSSGNHAQAVALSAQLFGVPATIVMPTDAPPAKIAATRGYGAEIVFYDRYKEDRTAIAERKAAELGATLIPPYDHPMVMAGNGTTALELLEEAGELDLLLVCLGGGGLLSGCATAAKALSPGIEIWGVEPAAGDDWAQSYARGERVKLTEVPRTIADGQQTEAPGRLTWATARPLVRGIATVSDDQIRDAMRFLFERVKLVTEPSGASALAALLSGVIDGRGRRVGVIISGGNIGIEGFCQIISQRDAS
jgi:threonine dehydratase